MKKLIVFGQERPWDKELEMFSEEHDAPYGFNCKITYLPGERYDIETRHNCTEFHHRYDYEPERHSNPHFESTDENARFFTESSAFESDIHSIGGTKYLNLVQSIEITKATKKHDNY